MLHNESAHRSEAIKSSGFIYFFCQQTYRHSEWSGPYLGPKPADECKRDFSEEVLKAGQTIVGLQAGSNKGATQAGSNMGAGRKILLGKWTPRLRSAPSDINL